MDGRRPQTPNPRVRSVVFVLLAGSLLALYLVRPDGAQALHWWPMAIWTPVVLLPFLTLRPRALARPFGLALAAWAVSLAFVGEPSASSLQPVHGRREGEFRVVSLNCAGGSAEAAREAFAQRADLVLLQEVGTQDEFVRAARAAGYPFAVYGADGAVFSRTPLRRPAKALDFAAGSVELGDVRLRVVSLRLLPPVFRLDLWNPQAWREYAIDAARRRSRMRELLAEAGALCLVGGDFNATNPRLVTDARPEMREAGRSAARGWRGTGTNDFPVVWTDQVWATPEVRWRQMVVRKTQNSDHRMVVADFRL